MWPFTEPKCPKCGRETVQTGYCAPYSSHRCNHCVSENRKEKALLNRIEKLERQLKARSASNA